MTFRHEYAQWQDELNPPVKPTIAERLKAWIGPPKAQPVEPDVYAWRDVSDLFTEQSK